MKLLDPIPTLTAPSLQDTVDFYVSVLDFTCKTMDDQWKFASIKKDNVTMQLVHPQAKSPFSSRGLFAEPVFTGAIYIHIDGIDELWEKVKDKAEVCFPVQDFDYGMREFGIYDNNGYLLQFGQQISA
ncbi:VOC family protein [Chitinophaga sp. SYP-B3965]|uniref:VOC family protein n=1 Tax=Chitinophaga sp. SYP-B3965 TaxID=2663120 RepID=UPI0015672922|nr:VOC family protein [Chitinophaga sp. SYP-B3965]